MNNHHHRSPKFTKIHKKGDKTQLNGLGAGADATAGVAASAEAELVPVRCCRRRPHPASCGSAWRNSFPMRDGWAIQYYFFSNLTLNSQYTRTLFQCIMAQLKI
jgi:hypothetical protein